MDVLEISPKTVTLTARQAQVFQAMRGSQIERDVKWSLLEGDGTIKEDSGVYRSPRWIFRSRRVIITARPRSAMQASGPTDPPATATVELTAISFWTQALGLYWLICLVALSAVVLFNWRRLCPACSVLVSPPVVTLTGNQTQAFSANVPVAWAPLDAANGLYRAPAPDRISDGQRLAVTVASKADPEETSTAEIFLTTDFGFSLHPARSTVYAGGSVDLAPVMTSRRVVEWLQPSLGTLRPVGAPTASIRFQAPGRDGISKPMTVTILARTRGERQAIAGAHVTILPDKSYGKSSEDCAARTATGLLSLIALLGALGGLIHGISSFTTYVGNRQFLPSWIWWYIFKPFLGALVAVVVYLVFRAGLGGGDYALSTADCLTSAAFAALIGLFAEPATIKLKDIFDTLFTPRQDPRKDRAGKAKGATLSSLEPSSLKMNTDPLPPLRILGSGFTTDSRVKIGMALRPTDFVSATELKATLIQSDVERAQTLSVIVYNEPPEGAASNSLTLTVE